MRYLNLRQQVLLSAAIAALITLTPYFVSEVAFENVVTLQIYLVNLLYAFTLSWVNVTWFRILHKHGPSWTGQPARRMILGIVGSVVLTTLGLLVCRFVHLVLIMGYRGWDEFFIKEPTAIYVWSILLSLVISLIFHAAYFYKEIQQNKVRKSREVAGAATSQLDALKNQLDPHFLFNSLNVLSSLIEEDPDRAQSFTAALSKVYRYVLEQKHETLVSVDSELQFARTYVRLLKMRFDDSIIVDIPRQSENPDGMVVPLSLQLLLENAVKHNKATTDAPLSITIEERNGQLIVINNLQARATGSTSTGVGLQNIKQRYAQLTDLSVDIKQDEEVYQVGLPILTQIPDTPMEARMNTIDNARQRALERVALIKEFYQSLATFGLLSIGLLVLNLATSPGYLWCLWPIGIFTLITISQFLKAYGYSVFFGPNWEQRKIEELMRKESNRYNR